MCLGRLNFFGAVALAGLTHLEENWRLKIGRYYLYSKLWPFFVT